MFHDTILSAVLGLAGFGFYCFALAEVRHSRREIRVLLHHALIKLEYLMTASDDLKVSVAALSQATADEAVAIAQNAAAAQVAADTIAAELLKITTAGTSDADVEASVANINTAISAIRDGSTAIANSTSNLVAAAQAASPPVPAPVTPPATSDTPA